MFSLVRPARANEVDKFDRPWRRECRPGTYSSGTTIPFENVNGTLAYVCRELFRSARAVHHPIPQRSITVWVVVNTRILAIPLPRPRLSILIQIPEFSDLFITSDKLFVFSAGARSNENRDHI